MKRLKLLLTAMLFVVVSAFGATDYGLTVGGVDITSDNCQNVTGDNIKPYKDGGYYVKYDSGRKELWIKNVKIERTGSYNRAILNNDVDGLKIVFVGENYLKAEDSSPVRLNNNTTITSQDANATIIIGGDEDAITVGNGKTLTIDEAHLEVSAESSSAIEGNDGDETVIVKGGSALYATTKTYSSSNASINNLALFRVEDSYVVLYDPSYFGRKIKSFECVGDYMRILNGEYSETGQWFVNNSTIVPNVALYIGKGVLFSDTNYFPDQNFANALVENNQGMFKKLLIFPTTFHSGTVNLWTSIDVSNKNIGSLTGIEFFTDLVDFDCSDNHIGGEVKLTKCTALQSLDMSNNNLSSIDLTKNTALKSLNLSKNSLNSSSAIDLTKNTALMDLNISNNVLSSVDLSKNTALTSLTANSCYLTSIDLSKNTALTSLYINENQLTALNVSNNTALKKVECSYNKITTLDFSKNTFLRNVSCFFNQIYDVPSGVQNGESFVVNLPNIKPEMGVIRFLDKLNDHNSLTEDQVKIAVNKNWILENTEGTTYFGEATSAVNDIWIDAIDNNAPRYNLMGQPVDGGYRGIVIQNGKKILIK